MPLIVTAGTETRYAIGVVILFGVIAGTFFTLFILLTAYDLLGKDSVSPKAVARQLE